MNYYFTPNISFISNKVPYYFVSETTFKVQKTSQITSEKPSIVQLFLTYCAHELEANQWEELNKIPSFVDLVDNYAPKYRTAAFQALVNVVADHLNKEVRIMLKEFSTFANKYY